MRKTICLQLLSSATAIAAISLFASSAHAVTGDIYETNMSLILRMNPSGGTPITFSAGLPNPKGIVFDGTGKFYVADANRGTVQQYSVPDGTSGLTYVSDLSSPVGLAFNPAGDLFIGESGNGNVSRLNVTTGVRTDFVSGLGAPSGLAFAGNGNLFVTDFSGGNIYQVTPDGTKSTFATGLNLPSGLAFDSNGNLFEADSGSGTIFQFAPDGTRTTFASDLSEPYGLAFEAGGTLIVSDHGSGTTYRYATDGSRGTIFTSDFNTPQFVAIEPATHQLLNMSTRGTVGTGEHILIAGFFVSGIGPVGIPVVVRVLGPSLEDVGIADFLADPALEVRDASGTLIAFNNDWMDASDTQKVTAVTLQPTNDHEAALQLTLLGGSYTALAYGVNNTTGTALVEVYKPQ